MSLDNIESAAIELAELTVTIKALTEKKKELEQQVRPALADKGDVVFGEYKFTCTTSAGRRTLDKKKLMDHGVNVDEFMTVGKPFSTLKIVTVD